MLWLSSPPPAVIVILSPDLIGTKDLLLEAVDADARLPFVRAATIDNRSESAIVHCLVAGLM